MDIRLSRRVPPTPRPTAKDRDRVLQTRIRQSGEASGVRICVKVLAQSLVRVMQARVMLGLAQS